MLPGVRVTGISLFPSVHSRWVPAALALLLLTGYELLASTQVTTTGTVRVVATDQDGLPIPGATATAAEEDAATTRVGFTEAAGLAELRALSPSARYVVTVELAGFRSGAS